MTFRVNIQGDIDQMTKSLNRLERRQVPFATALALTNTAKESADEINEKTPRYLDRPVSFTKKSFGYERATKRDLSAYIQAKPIQENYLRYMVEGGTRGPKKRAIPVPFIKNVKLNKFGNMPRGFIKKLLARPDTFSGTHAGIAGIWQRQYVTRAGNWKARGKGEGGSLRLLVAYEPRARYSKTYFPFYRLAEKDVRKRFPIEFDKALKRALATAR